MARRANDGEKLHPRCVIFGKLMREDRKSRDLNQAAYAKAAGTSRQKIGSIERGEAAADADLLFKLEDAGLLRAGELMKRTLRHALGLADSGEDGK